MALPNVDCDYFRFSDGKIQPAYWRRYWKFLRLLDAAADIRIASAVRRLQKAAQQTPPQTILLASVEVPLRKADLARVVKQISSRTRHHVTTAITAMAPVGKYDNIARAISPFDLTQYDWLLVIDDDIEIPDGFLDILLYFGHAHQLKLAQPAHKFRSYSTYRITERHWASLARYTGYVECGPVTLFHRDTFSDLMPFPSLRWAWGLDVKWSDIAHRRGWKLGIVDAIPIAHLRPVGKSYDYKAAREEAEEFIRRQRISMSAAEIFAINSRIV